MCKKIFYSYNCVLKNIKSYKKYVKHQVVKIRSNSNKIKIKRIKKVSYLRQSWLSTPISQNFYCLITRQCHDVTFIVKLS